MSCDMNKFTPDNARSSCMALESGEGCTPKNLEDCRRIQNLCGPQSMDCSGFIKVRDVSTDSSISNNNSLTLFNIIQIVMGSVLILIALFILIALIKLHRDIIC
jgi:hypothetical protein